MNEKPTVSIVIPIYNMEKHLRKCLDSVVAQTYGSLEIIPVNDGSTDGSEEIIREYARKDSRIVSVTRKNGGVGAARNSGAEHATGKYLCFVDSDDRLAADYVEKMVTEAEAQNADMVVCSMSYCFADGRVRRRTPKIRRHEVITGTMGLREELLGNQYKFHAPNKMVKTSILKENGIVFPEGKIYEDVFTTWKWFLKADRVSLLPEVLYYYLQGREDSIMGVSMEPKRMEDLLEALHHIMEDPEVRARDVWDGVVAMYCTNIVSLVNYIYPLYRLGKKDLADKYRDRIKEDSAYCLLREGLKSKALSAAMKIRVWMIIHSFRFYCELMCLLKVRLS